MLNKNNPIYAVILIFNIVFIFPCAAINIMDIAIASATLWIRLGAVFSIIALVASLIYVIKGFSKSHAWAYKLFLICFALMTVFEIIESAVSGSSLPSLIISAIVLCCIIILSFIKNLGKTVSFLLCAIIIVSKLVNLIINVTTHPGALLGGELYYSLIDIRVISSIITGILLTLITYAKYTDKAARGRKM